MPYDLNVTTIYYNSIEIEWKQSGLADILYYMVKYRPVRARSSDDTDYLNVPAAGYTSELAKRDDQQEQHDDDDDDDDDSDHIEDDANDSEEYQSVNTTNTKLKVGTSLRPFTLYEFKVIAANTLGLGKETPSIQVRTAPTSKFSFVCLTQKPVVCCLKKMNYHHYLHTEPGQVRNIRYTFENEQEYLIRCDEPLETNGNLIVITSSYTITLPY